MRKFILSLLLLTLAVPVYAQRVNGSGVRVSGQETTTTFTDGTVTLPGITFWQDTDTGFNRLGSGLVDFSSNGVKTFGFPSTAPTDAYMLVWDAGTARLVWVPNAVTVAGGGTGVATFGGANTLLYTSAADTLTSLANAATGNFLMATTGAAPSWNNNVARLSANTFTADQAMGGFKITGLGAPGAAGDAATKAYVDAIGSGIHVHPEVLVATVADITLANSQTIGGVALVNPNRVLVKNQAAPADNGCYVVVNAGAWTRCTELDTDAEAVLGATYFVVAGTVNANSSWIVTTAPATLGADPLVFSTLSKAEALTFSAPLVRTINNVALTQSGITGLGTVTSGTLSTGVTVELDNATFNGTLAVANGGTNLSSYTIGDLPYASGATTISKLPIQEGYILAAGAAAPKWVRDAWVVHQSSARCQGTTATSFLNLPSGGTAASPVCTAGTNITRGTIDYTDGGGNHSASLPFYLMDDFDATGDTKFEIYWNTTATTGNVIWSVQTACVGDGETPDPAYNAAQTVTTAAQGVTTYRQKSVIAVLTMTGCAAGETLFVKVDRNGATSGDTLGATASLIAIEIKYFRKW